MLRRMILANFTAFRRAEMKFSGGLNLFVGENGSGKSHVLKAAYSVTSVLRRPAQGAPAGKPTKEHLKTALARKLKAVFRPDTLGSLVHRPKARDGGRVAVEMVDDSASAPAAGATCALSFKFGAKSEREVIPSSADAAWIEGTSVFLPPQELLSIHPGFVSLYEGTDVRFEETWRDTCSMLGLPRAKGERMDRFRSVLDPLEKALGGEVELDGKSGRFRLRGRNGMSTFESPLVSEGFRKLAMLDHLVANGSLGPGSMLYWDEPDANLNPKSVRVVAEVVLMLAGSGIQVFAATHSLFLVREIDILLRRRTDVPAAFFGLHKKSDHVVVQQSDSLDGIGDIASLDEDLRQSDRWFHVQSPMSGSEAVKA